MSVAIDRRPAGKYEVNIPEADYKMLGKIAKRLGRHANAPALFTQLAEKYVESYKAHAAKDDLPEIFSAAEPLPGPHIPSSIRVANEIKAEMDKIAVNHGEGWDFDRTIVTLAHLGLQDLLDGPLAGKMF